MFKDDVILLVKITFSVFLKLKKSQISFLVSYKILLASNDFSWLDLPGLPPLLIK